jgi:hypothetical protein
VHKALSAKRESKSIEFKQQFDINSGGDWCEVIKDLVARRRVTITSGRASI